MGNDAINCCQQAFKTADDLGELSDSSTNDKLRLDAKKLSTLSEQQVHEYSTTPDGDETTVISTTISSTAEIPVGLPRKRANSSTISSHTHTDTPMIRPKRPSTARPRSDSKSKSRSKFTRERPSKRNRSNSRTRDRSRSDAPSSRKKKSSLKKYKDKQRRNRSKRRRAYSVEEELDETEIELEQQKHAVRLLKAQNEYLRKQNEEFIMKYGAFFGNKANSSSYNSSYGYNGHNIKGASGQSLTQSQSQSGYSHGHITGNTEYSVHDQQHEIQSIHSRHSSHNGSRTPSVDNISLSQVSYSKQSQSNTNIQQATSINTTNGKSVSPNPPKINIDYHTNGIWDHQNTQTVLYEGNPISPISPLTPLAGLTSKQTKIILSFSQQSNTPNVINENDTVEYKNNNDGFPDTPGAAIPTHQARACSVPVCN